MLCEIANSFHCGSQCVAHAARVYLDGPGLALSSVALYSDRRIILDARGATVVIAVIPLPNNCFAIKYFWRFFFSFNAKTTLLYYYHA